MVMTSSLLDSIRQAEPEFVDICSALVRGRWSRFIREHDPSQYRDGVSSFSYPVLRPSDFKLMTEWDGECFPPFWRSTLLSEFIISLIGDEVKAAGLKLAWHSHFNGGEQTRSLQVSNDTHRETSNYFVTYLIA